MADAEPILTTLARRLCGGNTDDARDLVQDAFERVTRQGIPEDVTNTRAWLTTIVHNLFVDRCRAQRRRPAHEQLDEECAQVTQLDADPPEPEWLEITIDHIQAALDEIEPVYRDVYRLHTFEHLSYAQIAARLGIRQITVGTRLNRARKKLRDVLVKRFGLERPR